MERALYSAAATQSYGEREKRKEEKGTGNGMEGGSYGQLKCTAAAYRDEKCQQQPLVQKSSLNTGPPFPEPGAPALLGLYEEYVLLILLRLISLFNSVSEGREGKGREAKRLREHGSCASTMVVLGRTKTRET
ncbi:hypothetical protein AXG93_441s1090 [Marchantia polymorpha subsp. ruderalis]|uniref:Uncharacterized protein n=1 Tax=Marchantia polymorpha subsp. ruderalis TaxID=1480154 RepID=A0A176W2R5_MARPO|nr:hypothetical protein AXG93_441s1090 [Marchantia polymorpha subsp. ruderalis]